jgi:pimeloyl-ACP methyl ester carboxylesterase
MRGYGRSSIYTTHADYALEHSIHDMLDLLAHLGRDRAIWVGHDWGSPVVWSLASHHPAHCSAVANLYVRYIANGFAVANLIAVVNREVYPQSVYPAGQWEYQLFYEENFERARSAFEADIEALSARSSARATRSQGANPPALPTCVAITAWFGGAEKAPSIPRDPDVISEEDLSIYTAALPPATAFMAPIPGT